MRGEQARGGANLLDRYPGDRCGFFWSKLPCQCRKPREGRLANDSLAIMSCNAPCTGQREQRRRFVIETACRIINHRLVRVLVPGDKARSRAARREIRFGKRRAVVAPNQKCS